MNPGTFQGAGLGTIQQTGIRRQIAILSSRTYTIQYSGNYLIYCIGAGGSGSAQSGPLYIRATGGGAGGLAVKQIFLPARTVLTITIGAGGAGTTAVGNGNAGGATSVYGPGLALYATGGSGGTQDATTAAGTISGAAGGIASGGDWNLTGGASGDAIITGSLSATRAQAFTGGGAVAFLGTPYAGGTATAYSSNFGSNIYSYSGGAGVGGNGGGAINTFSGSQTSSGGAGSWYSAGNTGINTAGAATVQIGSPFGFGSATGGLAYSYWDYLVPYGIGQAGASTAQSTGYGNGSSGGLMTTSTAILGGTGGADTLSGTAYLGGGSGAVGGSTSGSGGSGAVILTWVQ